MKPVSRLLPVLAALLLAPVAAQAQQAATITGRVTSEGGAPLAAAQVYIETLGLGAQSADDGRFTLTIPAARVNGQTVTLGARVIGYRSKTVQVTLRAGTIAQDFVLEANPLRLGEVV